MLPDRVSNPGPLTCESGALPIALRGPARFLCQHCIHKGVKLAYFLILPWISTAVEAQWLCVPNKKG